MLARRRHCCCCTVTGSWRASQRDRFKAMQTRKASLRPRADYLHAHLRHQAAACACLRVCLSLAASRLDSAFCGRRADVAPGSTVRFRPAGGCPCELLRSGLRAAVSPPRSRCTPAAACGPAFRTHLSPHLAAPAASACFVRHAARIMLRPRADSCCTHIRVLASPVTTAPRVARLSTREPAIDRA